METSQCSTTQSGNTTSTLLLIIKSFSYYFPQTLATLDLRFNRIDHKGAKHLARGLQQNKVTESAFFFLLLNHSVIIFHRH
jgi:hypothetical protein